MNNPIPKSQILAGESLQASMSMLEQEIDRAYYFFHYPDVEKAGVDPLRHYLKHGWREGRNPSPRFHTRYYLSKNPQVASAGLCPLTHYVEAGRALGLSGHAFTRQTRQYALEVLGLDLAAIDLTAATSYVMEMFDAAWYLAGKELPPDALTPEQALRNYEALDLPSGAAPGPLFDTEYYLNAARELGFDMRGIEAAPFLHWLVHGMPARVSPTKLFHPETYQTLNKDVRNWNGWAFEHWIARGINEDRPFDINLRIGKSVLDKKGYTANSPTRAFLSQYVHDRDALRYLDEIGKFRRSEISAQIMDRAVAIEPAVGDISDEITSMVPPFFGGGYADFRTLLARIPRRSYKNIVLIPFCKMGGADYVAGVLASALADQHGNTLVLRTDDPSWERADWFPDNVPAIDISDVSSQLPAIARTRLLYEIIRWAGVRRIFNVNSKLAYETISRYGARINTFSNIYTYYFCADRTLQGTEVGYAVRYFAAQLPTLKAALFDNRSFADQLTERYCLDDEMQGKLRVLYQPSASLLRTPPAAEDQRSSRADRTRPLILWAGRLDRQKRFDLVVQIAKALPDVDFRCWGKAVLERPMPIAILPPNLSLQEPFLRMDELPLAESDGWLYTSDWDGIPNILVESAAKGMAVVASVVGGIGELIDEATGWPVPGGSEASAYVAALRAMLSDPNERVVRTRKLQERVRERHSVETYRERLSAVLNAEGI